MQTSDGELSSAPEYAHTNLGGGVQPNDDSYAKENVVLRMEYMSDSAMRLNIAFFRSIIALCAFSLVGVALWKFEGGGESLTHSNKIIIYNVVISAVCCVFTLIYLVSFVVNVVATIRSGRKWNPRRMRLCILSAVDLVVGVFIVIFYLYPNAYVLWVEPCGWFLATVERANITRSLFISILVTNQMLHGITMLPNRVLGRTWHRFRKEIRRRCGCIPREDTGHDSDKEEDDIGGGSSPMGIDLPWQYYCVVFLVLWLPYAAMTLVNKILFLHEVGSPACSSRVNINCYPFAQHGVSCHKWKWECESSGVGPTIALVNTSWGILIMLLYFTVVYLTGKELNRLPYNQYRIAHIQFGLQVPTRTIAILFYFLSASVLWFVQYSTCNSVIFTQMGVVSVEGCLVILVCISSYVSAPIAPGDKEIKLHAWLQDHAWTEKDIPAKLKARPFTGEPCFCFETAIKCHYFSMLIYDLEEIYGSPYTLKTAMGLYGLDQHRLFLHHIHDTKCLVAWSTGNGTIVLSFRGTASLANIKADLKVWRAVHEPKEGNYWLGTCPLVHAGFLMLWNTSGLQSEVVTLLKDITSQPTEHGRPWRIIATGHSLGGALAQLAAFDVATIISRNTDAKHIDLTCITYGCPRPGNRAFARRFISAVPDAWDIIHTSDVVARAGKFIFLYKRAAYPVIVTSSGDLIVRPSRAEHAIRRGAAHSIKDHLLSSYAQSLRAIMENQFGEKAIIGGRDAFRIFSTNTNIRQIIQMWVLEGNRMSTRKLLAAKTLRRMTLLMRDEDEDICISNGTKLMSMEYSESAPSIPELEEDGFPVQSMHS